MMDNAWPHLDGVQRRAMISTVVGRRRRELLNLPNVLSIGEGIRVVNGKWTSDPCVRVFVRRKWKGHARRPGCVPEHLTTYLRIRGRRVSVSVPCDVEPMPATRLHAGDGPCRAVLGEQAVTGTACCIVRATGSSSKYLLGCNHVFGLTLRGPPLDPAQQPFSQVRISLDGRDVGHLHDYAYPAYYDAALARLETNVAPTVRDNNQLRRLSGVAVDSLSIPATYRILRGTGSSALVRYHSITPWEQCGYGGAVSCYRFRRVLFSEYLEDPAGDGDSGSPIVDDAGYLIAMHFGGNDRFSVSFPIYDLLTAFASDVRVVT